MVRHDVKGGLRNRAQASKKKIDLHSKRPQLKTFHKVRERPASHKKGKI